MNHCRELYPCTQFQYRVCSKLANIKKEATAFEATRSTKEKEEKTLGMKSIVICSQIRFV